MENSERKEKTICLKLLLGPNVCIWWDEISVLERALLWGKHETEKIEVTQNSIKSTTVQTKIVTNSFCSFHSFHRFLSLSIAHLNFLYFSNFILHRIPYQKYSFESFLFFVGKMKSFSSSTLFQTFISIVHFIVNVILWFDIVYSLKNILCFIFSLPFNGEEKTNASVISLFHFFLFFAKKSKMCIQTFRFEVSDSNSSFWDGSFSLTFSFTSSLTHSSSLPYPSRLSFETVSQIIYFLFFLFFLFQRYIIWQWMRSRNCQSKPQKHNTQKNEKEMLRRQIKSNDNFFFAIKEMEWKIDNF